MRHGNSLHLRIFRLRRMSCQLSRAAACILKPKLIWWWFQLSDLLRIFCFVCCTRLKCNIKSIELECFCEWMYTCIYPVMSGCFMWVPKYWCFVVKQRSWTSVHHAKIKWVCWVVHNDHEQVLTVLNEAKFVLNEWRDDVTLQSF